MNAPGTLRRRFATGLAAAAALTAALPALAGMWSLLLAERGHAFVDQRFQSLWLPGGTSRIGWAAALLAAALGFFGGLEALRRRGTESARQAPEAALWSAVRPLCLLVPLWFCRFSYPALPLAVLCLALAAGRFAAQLEPSRKVPELSDRRAWAALGALVLLAAAWTACRQYRSHSQLGMQWLDWGHYYEALLNTWRGKFFHLNLSRGCFLGSRFCPSLLILSAALPFGVPGFFFAGSLLVASGALPVYALARHFKATPAEGLLFGVWYLVLPGTVNLELPLLDGFHEVFLLFPAVLCALLAYVKGRLWTAGLLVLFAFGVRETVPFMFLGAGATLFILGRRRHGLILAAASLAALVLTLGVLMPLARPETRTVYDHVTFYPHLGNSVMEIALSPVLRPKAFWGAVFSAHSLCYYAVLFLPFLFLAAAAPEWWLPMLFDLAMVAADRRFDSQTLLRHYQCAMLITLIAASLEGFRRLRSGTAPRYATWLWRPGGGSKLAGAAAATGVATLGLTLFFTQIPGLPGSDPRLENWSDARELVAAFAEHVEPGAEITAGPRLAGFFVGRNEVFLSHDAAEPLKRYVIVESFVPDYRQRELAARLLADPGWTLLKSEYLDKRLIQLFEHKKRTSAPDPGVTAMTETQWQNCGVPLPCRLPGVRMRARSFTAPNGQKYLVVAVRLAERVDFDLGFTVGLNYADAPPEEKFVSFGDGLLPADRAPAGAVYRFALPLAGELKECRVDQHLLGVGRQEF